MKLRGPRIGAIALVTIVGLALVGPALPTLGAPQEDPWLGEQDEVLNQARGERALEEAREHEAAGRFRLAADSYATVLLFIPGQVEAQQGLERMRRMMNEGTTIDETQEELTRLRDLARIELNESLRIAQSRLDQGDYAAAQQEALKAQIKWNQRRDVIPPTEFEARNNELRDLLARVEQARENARILSQRAVQVEKQQEAMRREAQAREERQRLINENLRRVRQLQMEMKYKEALQVLDEILFIDELNPAAQTLRDLMETDLIYQDWVDYTRRRELGHSSLSVENLQSTIPPRQNLSGPGPRSTTGIVEYPEDWPQLSYRRTGESGFQQSPQDRQVQQRLSETTIPIDFNNNTLEQVVTFLGQVTGQNIYVDWKALDFIGVNPSDEVNLQLSEVPVMTAIDRILEQVGDDVDRPQWDIQDGILVISSDEQLRKRTVTIVYDIRDLLFEVPYFDNAPQLDLDSALNQGNFGGGNGGGGGGNGGGGGGGGGGFGGGGGGGSGGQGGGSIFGDPEDAPDRRSRGELIDQIVTILQENVDPEGWRDLGGETGSLQELNGNLIITNTPRNHQSIVGLLSQLREIRALQINVEGRFLEVRTDWFEQIGVDLDLYFNTNNGLFDQLRAVDPTAHLSDFFRPDGTFRDPLIFGTSTIGVDDQGNPIQETLVPFGSLFGVPAGPPSTIDGIDYVYASAPVGAPIRQTDGFSPIPFVQNSFGAVSALANLTAFGTTAIANPALTTAVSYLDDIQVDLLIQATQADQRSVVVTSPRLTLFNGQRSWVAVTQTTTFVSGLTAVAGDASGAFVPNIAVLRTGFVLDVEAVTDASRRYVTMTVIASLAQNPQFRESDATEFSGAAGGGGGIGGNAAEFAGRVELPQITVSLVQTTVSVPDKGTMLLGGQRFVNEIEVESGVPVLSKIPFINRFFTNRLTNKEERALLILIRPEIIITQENEDILFPGLSDTIGTTSYMR